MGNSLYFSVVSADFIFTDRPFDTDGKFYGVFTGAPVLRAGELPDDMIQARSEVVNDLPGEHRKSWRNGLLGKVYSCLSERLNIVATTNSVFAFLEKPNDLRLKITDTLVGPF